MGRQIAEAYPAAGEVFSRADEILGFPISRLCFEGPDEELRRTANAQPALLTCSLAIFRVLDEKGLRPGLLAGHSLGEFAAWVAADVLDFSTALALVRKRGELMEEAARSRPGGMLAVLGVDEKTLERLLSKVKQGTLVIANLNCPGQIVVSGMEPALRKLREFVLQEEGARAIPLRVSGAFHSPLMTESAHRFKQETRKLRLSPAKPAVVCNLTARPVKTPEAILQAMGDQMTSPVLWEASIRQMAKLGSKNFVEVGPGEVLCGLVRRTLNNVSLFSTGEPGRLEEVIEALGRNGQRAENTAIEEAPAAPGDGSQPTTFNHES
jgi:[acyl-carrier-protein] S-malonyltransferase